MRPASGSETNRTLWPRRYDLLDGWRGLAALVVVCHHVSSMKLGHWAVLVFFVISGYCISASADSCQQKGVGVFGFMRRRIRRIYPPYLLALAFFSITRIAKFVIHGTDDLARFSAVEVIQNLTLMQWWTLLVHPQPQAFNNPTLMVTAFWSLGYEEQFYLLVSLMLMVCLVWRRAKIVHFSLALTVLCLAWMVLFGRLSYGLFLDYWVLFGLGALVYMRLSVFRSPWARSAVDVFLVGLVGLSAVMTYLHPCDKEAGLLSGQGRAVFGELLAGGCFSLFLIATRVVNDIVHRSVIGRAMRFLGLISYSLYLVHQFNLELVQRLVRVVLPAGSPTLLWGALTLCAHVGVATVFWYFCERPFLNEPIAGREPAVHVA